jgi:EAL domain-containing protein (putative c-di-GMP-specific phosphodiesterase class I)
VLQQACRQLAAWESHDHRRPPLGLSVNLSARQLRDRHLPERVAQALATSGLDPHRLTLEVTETSMIDDLEAAGATLRAIRALGVHLAVDDFGTGFSALGALKHYPVDSLKIDRSFVDGLGSDAQDTAIVHAVVAFAKTLGLSVTAEGIETADQLTQLRALGCDHGQGYYFAKPLQRDSVEPFLNAHQSAARPPADRQAHYRGLARTRLRASKHFGDGPLGDTGGLLRRRRRRASPPACPITPVAATRHPRAVVSWRIGRQPAGRLEPWRGCQLGPWPARPAPASRRSAGSVASTTPRPALRRPRPGSAGP